MTNGDWLKKTTRELSNVGVSSPRLDALVLLEDATRKDRSLLLTHPETPLAKTVLDKLNRWVNLRLKHEPLAYIRGKTEFYNREFIINHDVLEPRPESETMIDLLWKIDTSTSGGLKGRLLDLGTGSGALAITAEQEFPFLKIYGSDIDPKCLKVAGENAKKHNSEAIFFKADLLASSEHMPFDFIIANLPYVPDSHTINQAAMHEPKIAIFGGADGLDLYRKMFEQLKSFSWHPEYILTESLPPQHPKLVSIANEAGFKQIEEEDFIQIFQNS